MGLVTMRLLVLGFCVHLVSTSQTPDSGLPRNGTNSITSDAGAYERGASAHEAVPLFFESILSKLNSSSDLSSRNLTGLTVPSAFKAKRQKNAQILRWLNIGNGLTSNTDGTVLNNSSASLKRARRQAPKSEPLLSELPRWPGMPQGVLRSPQKSIPMVKRKILNMMLQSMYSAQERLWPMEPVIRKYEHLTPYRMAFVFMKLDQLVHEAHSILMYLERQTVEMTMTRRLQLYSHLMRRNVDVTYLVDYIMERVPRDQEVRVRQYVIRKEQERLMSKWMDFSATSKIPPQRPERVCKHLGACPDLG